MGRMWYLAYSESNLSTSACEYDAPTTFREPELLERHNGGVDLHSRLMFLLNKSN